MKLIRSFMHHYSIFTRALIFPFALFITTALFTVLIEIILPVILALLITNMIYSTLVGKSYSESIYEPYTYIRTKYYTTQ